MNEFMQAAMRNSVFSRCNRLRVGAVIIRNYFVIAHGVNGPLSDEPECKHPLMSKEPCEDSVHAEIIAIVGAARRGFSTRGATMYVTHKPCIKCARSIILCGIDKLVFAELYRADGAIQLLEKYGVEVIGPVAEEGAI